jgi:DNA phosphorothioation-associated putative methyltransferase
MDFRRYQELVKTISVGKHLPDAIYLHETALDTVAPELLAHLARAIEALSLGAKEWQVVKFHKRDHKITLLEYPRFLEDAYPALMRAYTINLETISVRESDFRESSNPPILHRKEAFLKPEHPSAPYFREITGEGEKAGLYDNPRSIGFRQSWERIISRKGFVLDQYGQLKRKANLVSVSPSMHINGEVKIHRHLTAIERDKLSAPMQALARHNYLDGSYAIFDYGCGKGDDVRELDAHGLNVCSWDPVYQPEGTKTRCDIVNLGYVINVIEDPSERDHVLRDAFKHAKHLLTVSAMLAGDATVAQFTPYKDGVLTKRNTFQKYYTQSELRSYIETTLNTNAIAVSPGIFFVFQNELDEQAFLAERQHIHREWAQLSQRERLTLSARVDTQSLFERHRELFDDFWRVCLDFGRIPANSEFEFSERLRTVAGSHKKAFDLIVELNGDTIFNRAREARKGDLLVYFALGSFGKRKPYNHMPAGLQRDIKLFFGPYDNAIKTSTDLLFSVGNSNNIASACEEAHKRLGCGLLDGRHSFTFHRSLIDQLPPILRVYIGCATQLYGDVEGVDLVKVHMSSGKVSLMRYDNFEDKPIPEMIQRVKINLRDQDIDVFDYSGAYMPHPLYFKSRFIPKNFRHYEAQIAFDRKLGKLDCLNFSGWGPSHDEFYGTLSRLQLNIREFDLEQ